MSQPPRKKSFKIEPFRHRVELDPQYAEKTWKLIESAINEIYNHNASGLSFEELYRNAYNMIVQKYGNVLYDGLTKAMVRNLQKIAEVVKQAQGEMFLFEVNVKWGDHNKSLQMIRDILMYMDRTFVVNNSKTPVHELGLQLWRNHVVRDHVIKDRLERDVLGLILKERNGEIVNRAVLRSVIKMFADLGPSVYQEDFEAPFLVATAEFYNKEAQNYLENLDCPAYLKQTERRLNEEMERVVHYVDKRTEARLAGVVDTEMIGKHMDSLVTETNSGLVALIERAAYDDLARMYTLFARVPSGLKRLLDVMSEHLREVGKKIVTDPEKTNNAVAYTVALMEEKEKYEKIVSSSFANDKQFQNAVNSAFEFFVNLNRRSPEYLSLYLDEKLRKGLKGMSEEETEDVLDRVVTLFRFLQEKDVFEKHYKTHLSKRLLHGKTASDDAEKALIVKLKTECGYQFTSKLEGMFNDMKISKDMMEEFAKHSAEDVSLSAGGPALYVQILTMGNWPTVQVQPCNLPPEVYTICDKFKQFYLESHSGRRLTWYTPTGQADVKVLFTDRKHELLVSTYQMCVLMLFNSSDTLTFKDILSATKIPELELKRALQSLSLVKGKNILRKDPMSKDVAEGDQFSVNESFSSKLLKIKISTVAPQKETEFEKEETRQKVEDDRKPQIEAAIVRIMKARRVLDHNNIISEVTKQLQSRFLPNPTVIKKRIESLIEREFLERDKVDRKLYRYLA